MAAGHPSTRTDTETPTEAWAGQSTGLIDRIEPAGTIVERIVREAEAIMRERIAIIQ